MHSLLLVIGDGALDEMMRPFDEKLEVPEYEVGVVDDFDKKRMMDYYREYEGVDFKSFDELYTQFGERWNGGCWRKGEDGDWHEYSTSNPQAQWDWYEIGGRWAGRIILKEGVTPIAQPHFSWGWSDEDKNKVLSARPYRVDGARIEDIANLTKLCAGAVLMDGVWMNNEDEDNFHFKPIKPFVENLPGDTLIRFVDYHS